MDRSRGAKRSQYRWNWRHIVAHAGGSGWLLGLMGQVLWNASGASANLEGDSRDDTVSILLQNFLQRTFGLGWNATKWTNLDKPLASVSLVLGVLSIWWNPRLSNKISGQVGRLIGLSEFYKLQGIINLTRLLAWYSIGKDHGFHLDASTTKAIHATMLIFNLVVSFISYRTVRIDSTPKVIFQDSPQTLHLRQPVGNQASSIMLSSPPAFSVRSSFNHHDHPAIKQFPIHRLASPSSPTYTPSYQPPTPLPEDDVDEMDWTPAKNTFEPSRPVQVLKPIPRATEPSPFHGRLPLPPMSKARYLGNPPSQPTFRKASAVQQQRFFGDIMSAASAENYDSDGTEIEGDDDLDAKRSTPTVNRINMEKPSFFARSDLEADTGLESLINGVFSLADDPPEIRAERERQIHARQLRQEDRNLRISETMRDRASWERIGSIVLLSLACLSWSYAGAGTVGAQILQYFALGTTAVIIGRALFDAIHIHQALWKASDILVLGVELSITIFLARAVKSSRTGDESAAYEYGSGPIFFLGALWVQEFVSFVQKSRASVSNVTPPIAGPPPTASNISELAVSLPPPRDQNLALASQQTAADISPSRTSSLAASTDHQPRRTKANRVEPSENLPGLSLGTKKKPGNATMAPRNSGWSNDQSIVTRSVWSSNGTPVWGRGNL
ncbi:hypothetical protein MMC15_005288 [Xylographa vitiligo]|nr:hypothetical protein [Xylographa vitiligo]